MRYESAGGRPLAGGLLPWLGLWGQSAFRCLGVSRSTPRSSSKASLQHFPPSECRHHIPVRRVAQYQHDLDPSSKPVQPMLPPPRPKTCNNSRRSRRREVQNRKPPIATRYHERRGWEPLRVADIIVAYAQAIRVHGNHRALLLQRARTDPHVHGKCQGRESRAELIIRDGRVIDIIYSPVRGRQPLEGAQLQDFQTLVRHHADDIVQKWIDYFVLHRYVEPEVITRRIK